MTTPNPQAPQKKAPVAQTQQADNATQPSNPRGLSADEAATKISSILSGVDPKKTPQNKKDMAHKPKPKVKAAPEEVVESDQSEGEDADHGTATEGDDDDGVISAGAVADEGADDGQPEDGETDDTQADDDDDGTLYTVKVNGKEIEVPLKELLQGYSRSKDYAEKTTALSKERKEVEAIKEATKDLPVQRETYVKGAERFSQASHLMLRAMYDKFMPKPPNPELAKSDPAAFWTAKEAHEEGKQFVGALQSELGSIQANLKKDTETTQNRLRQEGRVAFYKEMPEMAAAPARQKLREYANSFGFTDKQIHDETNHKILVFVEKARRWDELQARGKEIRATAPTPKVMKRTHTPETKRASHQNQRTNALSEHKQKGSLKTAERAIGALFSKRDG